MDLIFIRDLVVEATVGIYAHERSRPQRLQINLEIALASAKAGTSDRIGDTIDYGAVAESVGRALRRRRFNLVEKVAECIASLVLDEFGAPWVRVEVAKGPVLPGVRQVGVAIERARSVQPVTAFWQREFADERSEAG